MPRGHKVNSGVPSERKIERPPPPQCRSTPIESAGEPGVMDGFIMLVRRGRSLRYSVSKNFFGFRQDRST